MNEHPPTIPEPKPDLMNLSSAELSSNQEATVIPWFAGARKLPLTWIAPVYGLRSKKLTAPPAGISNALGIAQWFDGSAFLLNTADNLFGKNANRPTTTAWYGTIAGIACAGPADELVAVLYNGGTVWPTHLTWNDAVIDIPTVQRTRASNVATVEFAVPHGMKHNEKFVMSGLADGSFNEASATVVTNNNKIRIKYANAGANVAWTNDTGGRMSKVKHYLVGNLVRDGAAVWQCVLAHDALPATRPPNLTYWAAYSVTRGASPNPYPFTITGIGQAYFYWGTSGQVLDTAGEKILAATGHPPYRRQCVLVLVDVLFGSKSSAPNVEIILRRKPAQAIADADLATLDMDSQANPVLCLGELLTDSAFGIGQSAGLADAASWNLTAEDLEGVPGQAYISPMLNQQIAFRVVVASLLAYYDGWLRFGNAGAIESGRFSHNEAPPAFDGTTTLDFNDAIEEISYKVGTWSATTNETVVKFQDQLRAFKDLPARATSGLNRQIVGEPRVTRLDRAFITREAQALQHALEWSKINAQPFINGSIVVRAEKASAIRQGSLFKLTHDAMNLTIVCRCTQKILSAPPAQRAEVFFENERGIAPLPYSATPTGPLVTVSPGLEDFTLYRLVQPPAAMTGQNDFRLAVLAARKSDVTHGLRVWLKGDDAGLFYNVGQQTFFSVKGKLSQNFAINATTNDDDTENLQLNLDEFTVAADLERISATQTADSINDNSMLVWLFKAADPTQFEICTLRAIRLNAGVYKLKVRRGRYGTPQIAFVTGDEAWIAFRTDIIPYSHEKFARYGESGTAATFRLQAFTDAGDADLSDADLCPDVAFTFADALRPTVTWNVVQKKAVGDAAFIDISDFTTIFANTTQFHFGFSVDSGNAVIRQVALVARLGSKQVTCAVHNIGPQESITCIAPPVTLSDGTWEVYAVVTEASGRVTYSVLESSGFRTIGPLVGASGKVQSPLALPQVDLFQPAGGGFSGDVALAIVPVTSGALVWQSLTAPSATAPGAWTQNLTTTLTIPIGYAGQTGKVTKQSLWLYSTKTAKTDSEIVRYEFWYAADP